MTDFASSLPVRTETNGDVVVKVADGTTSSQLLAVDSAGKVIVKLDDGAGNAITSQTNGVQRALDVGIDVAGVQIDPRQIRTLTSTDVVTTSNLPTTVDTNFGTVGASTLRSAAEIGNASGAADFNSGATGAQTLRVAANQGAPSTAANGWFSKTTDGTNVGAVKAASTAAVAADPAVVVALSPNNNTLTNALFTKTTDGTNTAAVKAASTGALAADPSLVVALSPNSPVPTGTNLIGGATLYVGSSVNSATNPAFVTLSDTIGTNIDNYNTSAALSAGGTSNHDYTVTALKTFYTKGFWASASGKLKIEVQYETAAGSGTFNSFWVAFNSTANPNILIPLAGKTQVAGAKIRIIRTNEDKASQDVYSTTSGSEQ